MHSIVIAFSWPGVGLRVAVVIGGLVIWFRTQSWIGRKAPPKEGIGDAIHDLTAGWHHYLATHDRAANAALIVSSLFIDLTGLALIGGAIFGRTFAPFIAILIVFGLRQICQSMCTLPPPPGVIWRYPGFPALLVTYDVGNDLFFSGHTALAVLGGVMAAQYGPGWLAVAGVLIALGEIAVVLVLRAHYTLDVVAGIFAALFAADVAGHIAPLVDAWLG